MTLFSIQTLLAHREDTQACAMIIKLNYLGYFADFVIQKLQLHIFFNFVIRKAICQGKRTEHI